MTGVPGIASERAQALLVGANRIAYGQFQVRGPQVVVDVAVEDPVALKTVRTLSAHGSTADLAGLALSIAKQIDGRASVYPTRSAAALQAYATAMETPGAAAARPLEAAIAADPGFGPPYLMLSQIKIAQQDRAGAEALLTQAAARVSGMPPIDRARIELEAAMLRGDGPGRQRALAELAKATPDDATVWRALGEDAYNQRRFPEAITAFKKSNEVEPDANVYNTLGYAEAHAGNEAGARAALEQYAKMRPAEANPFDSLGDVELRVGKYDEAVKFYEQAFQKDRAFLGGGSLFKAAWARLYAGDVAAADALFARYIENRRNGKDPLVEFREAEWRWLTGRRDEGYANMLAFAKAHGADGLREMASRAYSQLAFWDLARGRNAQAAQMAMEAWKTVGQSSAGLAVLARFATQPPASASEWAVRGERAFAQPQAAGLRNLAVAYSLLFAREYAAALPLVRSIYQGSNPNTEESLPVLLAWMLLEAGKVDDAAPLLARTPIPANDGVPAPSVLSFPKILYLRGLMAEKQGRKDEAAAEYKKFLAVSGPVDLVWGDERHAREFVK